MSIEDSKNPLSELDVNALIDDIDKAYKDGLGFGFERVQLNEAEDLRSRCIATFFLKKLPSKSFGKIEGFKGDRQSIAGFIINEFREWQVNAHFYASDRKEEEAIRHLSLNHLSSFAEERVEDFKVQLDGMPLDNKDKKFLQERANYWIWVEEIMNEVAQLNWRGP